MHIPLVTLIVSAYDPAIEFFCDVLGCELVEDSPSTTNDGRPKRWVVVRPPGAETGLLLAKADGDQQEQAVGNQTAGRVGFFLGVDQFDETYARLLAAGVKTYGEPRMEPYGMVVVFEDLEGNKWDLLGSDKPNAADQ
ncbi:MAG: VOC family protein [Acidimicrobiia bacterium]|nr:VOC family protein [Acidimicrobiia bacterium]NNL46888.1 VOC family protein [Acidimicrobiia bacterium]